MPGSSSTTRTRATRGRYPAAMRVLSGRMDEAQRHDGTERTDRPRPVATSQPGSRSRASSGWGCSPSRGVRGRSPRLPPVSPEDLVASVLKAEPGPFEGTVQLDNELGLPALPDLPQAANGTSTGAGVVRRRRQGPRPDPEPHRRAHARLRRHDVLGVELRRPHRHEGHPPARPDPTRDRRPDQGRHRRARRAAAHQQRQRGRHRRGRGPPGVRPGAGARSRPSARCCARCASPSTRRSGCRCGSPCWRRARRHPRCRSGSPTSRSARRTRRGSRSRRPRARR